jgi:hypothetical protein
MISGFVFIIFQDMLTVEKISDSGEKSSHFIYTADSFGDAHQVASVRVPICRATPETVAGYGRLVFDYDAEQVEKVKWPKSTGWRPVAEGTGNQQVFFDT